MQRYLFNDGWMFQNKSGSSLEALMGVVAEAKAVTLPHDAVISTERVNDATYGAQGYYQGQNVSYLKTFELPEEWAGKNVWIEFEGIYQMASVYCNDTYVGLCDYGYGNYYMDLTNYLKAGKNALKVVVKNAPPAGRWYTGGGIYRDVQVYVGSALHVACEGTRVSTEDLDDGLAILQVSVPMVHTGSKVVDARVVHEVLDADGNVVSKVEAPVTVMPHESKELRRRMYVEQANLWDEDSPYLYTIRTTLYNGGEVSDVYTDTFGIRKLQLDPKHGLRVNGKVVKLRGGCIHHDSGALGAATFGNAEERRVRKLKEAGYNAIRSAHHPMGKALLRACDKLGVYVMDEFSDVWTTTKALYDYGTRFADYWEKDVTNMVLKDYNHPCVILYSIGNEIPETGNKFDVQWGKKLTDKIRSLDSTRYVMNSLNLMLSVMNRMEELIASAGLQNSGSTEEINSMMDSLGNKMGLLANLPMTIQLTEEACTQTDIVGYNYTEDRYALDAELHPDWILVGSETFPFNLPKNWSLVEKMPNVLGDFAWTSWDYLGESGIGKTKYVGEQGSFMGEYPWRIAYCGTIDVNGKRRPISYWREIVWGLRKTPYVSVCPPERFGQQVNRVSWSWSDSYESWNWPGYEGKPIEVEVYADADEIELFVNGKSVGVKKPDGEIPYFVTFETTYAPGEVKAVARKDGKETEYAITSAASGDCLKVEAEQQSIRANVEVGYVNISVADQNGVANPGVNTQVTVTVEGGYLAGLCNANPTGEENYAADTCATFQGAALAVVRAAAPGTMTVTVSAEGYAPATVTLEVTA